MDSFLNKQPTNLEKEKELDKSLKDNLFKIKQIPTQKSPFYRKVGSQFFQHMKDISFGSFIFFSVFLSVGVSVFLTGLLFQSFNNSSYKSSYTTSLHSLPVQTVQMISIETLLNNVSNFSTLTSEQQFSTIKNLVSFNRFQELNDVLNKLPNNFDKNLLTPLLYINTKDDGQMSSMALQERITLYNQSSTAFSNPNYFMTQQTLINHGADWKAYNYLFLKFSSNSDSWRMYWVNYLYKNDKKTLLLYEHILKTTLNQQQQYVIDLLEKIDSKK